MIDNSVKAARDWIKKQPVEPTAQGAEFIKTEMKHILRFVDGKEYDNNLYAVLDIGRFENALYFLKCLQEEFIEAYSKAGLITSLDAENYVNICGKYRPLLKEWMRKWIKRTGFARSEVGMYHILSQNDLLFGDEEKNTFSEDEKQEADMSKIPKF